jgi:hypothetical protein
MMIIVYFGRLKQKLGLIWYLIYFQLYLMNELYRFYFYHIDWKSTHYNDRVRSYMYFSKNFILLNLTGLSKIWLLIRQKYVPLFLMFSKSMKEIKYIISDIIWNLWSIRNHLGSLNDLLQSYGEWSFCVEIFTN